MIVDVERVEGIEGIEEVDRVEGVEEVEKRRRYRCLKRRKDLLIGIHSTPRPPACTCDAQ